MTIALNILVLIAAAIVPFALLLFVYGRVMKGRKKDHLAGTEPMGIGEDSGGDGGGHH